ncbi:CueP family metal-binding protein [Paenibacillus sp. sgz500958]|uniref:CueP family metal-binding protein n=1 Tax=Paenibacillus sp. sgz500958 TaxID=3242475 RepID=UPI0036D38C45
MRRKIVVVTGLVAFALGAYFIVGNSDSNNPAANPDPNIDIKQLVHDYSSGNLKAESASITSKVLTVTGEDNQSVTYNLPGDEFFLSIAPYIKTTHPCATHNLTGCKGELASKEFSVYIEDLDGKVIMDTTLKSEPNGFIDLWLPRDQKYRVKIGYDGKTANSEVSTFESNDTCNTTMQLM